MSQENSSFDSYELQIYHNPPSFLNRASLPYIYADLFISIVFFFFFWWGLVAGFSVCTGLNESWPSSFGCLCFIFCQWKDWVRFVALKLWQSHIKITKCLFGHLHLFPPKNCLRKTLRIHKIMNVMLKF